MYVVNDVKRSSGFRFCKACLKWLPVPGQKFVKPIVFMIVDAVQHVSEIGLWIKPG